MKVPFDVSFNELKQIIQQHYEMNVSDISFIPVGDKSYSYHILCEDGQSFYFKLLDPLHQREEIKKVDIYLPLLLEFHHQHLFPPAVCPILNKASESKTVLDHMVLIAFPWIEGDSLANAYPFSKEIVHAIARCAAKLHLTTSHISVPLPKEDFSISFLEELDSNIKRITNMNRSLPDVISRLHLLISSNRDAIYSLITTVKRLQTLYVHTDKNFVICHGDLWGGNIFYSKNNIRLIDWESVILAPMERELASYVTQRPFDFMEAYSEVWRETVKPDIDLLTYYCFSAQLENLHHWIRNILYLNKSPDQQENDLNMIEYHCLNRWDDLKIGLVSLSQALT